MRRRSAVIAFTHEAAPEWLRGVPAVEDWVDPSETPPGDPDDLHAWRALAEGRLQLAREEWLAAHVPPYARRVGDDDVALTRDDLPRVQPGTLDAEISEQRAWMLEAARCSWLDAAAFLARVFR